MDIERLGLSTRATRSLRSQDISTVEQLRETIRTKGPISILAIPNVGRGTWHEILNAVKKLDGDVPNQRTARLIFDEWRRGILTGDKAMTELNGLFGWGE